MAGLNYGYSYMKRGKDALNKGAANKRPVKAVDATTGETIGEYESVQDAVDKLGIPQVSLIGYCKKNRGIGEPAVYKKKNLILTYNEKPAF